MSHYIHSHIAHFYALAAPDFVCGPDAPAAERNILGVVAKVGLEVGGEVIKHRATAQRIQEIIGGKPTHPVCNIPGGLSKAISEDERKEIEEIAKSQIEFAKFSLKLFDDVVLANKTYVDIIVGDMDSVSDEALNSGAELIVHAYKDGSAPGLKRLEKLNLPSKLFNAPGTSEDIALLLAYERSADLLVAVGTHANLVEFLDKGRARMASTFLVRLKVGERLVDAKGVSKLYQSKAKLSHLLIFLFLPMVFGRESLVAPHK